MRPEKAADKDFEDREITKVEGSKEGGWSLNYGSIGFGIPLEYSDVMVPKVGMLARLYGGALVGARLRGLDLDGQEVFYRTASEDDAERDIQVEKQKQKNKNDYEAKRQEYERRVAALPEVFRNRILKFRKANPNFRWEYEDYELMVCEDAVKIAAYYKTKEGVEAFRKLQWEEQVKAGISDGHSGNSFAMACRLAMWYVIKPANVTREHGALVALVGCKDYGCEHPKSKTKKEKRMPRNTSNAPNGIKLMTGLSGGIEAQEARGQADLVSDDTLPTEIKPDCQAMLEKAGVFFRGPVKDDALFQHVTLPQGWKKVGTDHDMWSHLVDDKGEKRAAIFYKAAFYDRNAMMRLP